MVISYRRKGPCWDVLSRWPWVPDLLVITYCVGNGGCWADYAGLTIHIFLIVLFFCYWPFPAFSTSKKSRITHFIMFAFLLFFWGGISDISAFSFARKTNTKLVGHSDNGRQTLSLSVILTSCCCRPLVLCSTLAVRRRCVGSDQSLG